MYKVFRFASSKAITLDKSEMEFFNNLYHEWWDKNGKLKLLHSLNVFRTLSIQQQLINAKLNNPEYTHSATPLKGIKLLDIGCGGGILCESLSQLGADVTGIDPAPDLIQIAKHHFRSSPTFQRNPEFHETYIEEFCETYKEGFDAVVASEVIEHVLHPESFVECCTRCLKPGGSIIFTTMSKTRIGSFFNIYLLEDVLKMMPKGTHQLEKFVHPEELSRMINTAGCKTVDVKGFSYNLLTSTWRYLPVTWFSYLLHARKPTKGR